MFPDESAIEVCLIYHNPRHQTVTAAISPGVSVRRRLYLLDGCISRSVFTGALSLGTADLLNFAKNIEDFDAKAAFSIWNLVWFLLYPCFLDMHILLVLAIYFVFVLYGLTELFNFYFRQCILWKREISHSTTQPYQTQRWRQVKWQVSNPAIRNRVLKVKLKSLSSRKYMKTFFSTTNPKWNTWKDIH